MPTRAVIFDLDQTLLDRNASLLEFLRWQVTGMLKPNLDDPDAFISRFLELDNNGHVWKDEVYRQLIEEFELASWGMEELLSVYESRFGAFCVSRPGVVEVGVSTENHTFGARGFAMRKLRNRAVARFIMVLYGKRRPES